MLAASDEPGQAQRAPVRPWPGGELPLAFQITSNYRLYCPRQNYQEKVNGSLAQSRRDCCSRTSLPLGPCPRLGHTICLSSVPLTNRPIRPPLLTAPVFSILEIYAVPVVEASTGPHVQVARIVAIAPAPDRRTRRPR